MKSLFSVLLLALTFISCSKGGDDDDEMNPGDGKTTVNFTNKLPTDLNTAVVGSYNPVQAKLIKTIGTLSAGASTGEISITDKSVEKVYFYYDFNGKTYISDYGFTIAQGTFNNWNIDGNISFKPIEKNSIYYPK